MRKHGKKYSESVKTLGEERFKDAAKAIDFIKATAKAKFDETVEAAHSSRHRS